MDTTKTSLPSCLQELINSVKNPKADKENSDAAWHANLARAMSLTNHKNQAGCNSHTEWVSNLVVTDQGPNGRGIFSLKSKAWSKGICYDSYTNGARVRVSQQEFPRVKPTPTPVLLKGKKRVRPFHNLPYNSSKVKRPSTPTPVVNPPKKVISRKELNSSGGSASDASSSPTNSPPRCWAEVKDKL